MIQTHAAAMSTTVPQSTPDRAPAQGHLYIHAAAGPAEVHFMFEQQEKRLGGAMGASVISHGAFLLLILLIMRLAPEPGSHAMLLERAPREIIWLAEPGAGGGGGGGGNQQKEPIKKAELPGKEKLTVPVAKPPEPTPIPEVKPPEEQKINIPAVTLSAENETSPGLIESKENTTSQGTGTNGGAGTGSGTGIGNGQGSGLGEGSGGGTGGGVYRPGNGVESPRLLRSVRPNYTAEAMRAKVQGVVRLEGVVLPDGTVGDVKVMRSLDPVYGLDQEAVKAARQFRFVPGTRFGEPVAVLVSFEIEFTLR
jgi:periplasmic protein TonB